MLLGSGRGRVMGEGISDGILSFLDHAETAEFENDMFSLIKFLKAVEIGKEKHPGPLTKLQWRLDREEEIEEIRKERCDACSNCEGRCCNKLNNLNRYRNEVMDLAVVAYREGVFLDSLIEKERKFAGNK